jgi:hypothetical protein
MRRVEPPSLDSPWRGRHGDLDRLLSDFFRSELPHPWPEAPRPDEQPMTLPLPARKPRPRRSSWPSRLALVAAIALLLAGGWFLSGKFAGLSGPGSVGGHHEADKNPERRFKEDGVPRHRERIILDPSGRTEIRFDFDSP